MKKNRILISSIFLTVIFFISFSPSEETKVRLKAKNKEAVTFCKAKGYSTEICILIDMKLHSGKMRAFLYDMKKDSILASGMCAHGCGSNPWGATYTKDKPVFSNTPDSHCSSEIGRAHV